MLKRGRLGATGETAEHLVTLIAGGRSREALLAMLAAALPGATRRSRWARIAHRLTGPGLDRWLSAAGPSRRAAESLAREGSGRMPACEAIGLMFRYPHAPALMEYAYQHFVYRFGQPRHLVAASLATLIGRPARPVLEVACGFGHITRALVDRAGEGNVVGIDESFVPLYIARRWMAPTALFVCMDADAGLPFRDGSFAAAMCVDGLHYIRRKPLFVRELRRVLAPAAPMLLSATRNRLVPYPHPADALPAGAYAELVATMPHRIVRDADILARYLAKRGPDLSASTPRADQDKAEFLSIVAGDEALFRDHGELADWPHALGRLAINPLYAVEERDPAGGVRYRRRFPSKFYEDDNVEYGSYLPERVTIEPEVAADLAAGRRTAALEPLLARCVVVGLPESYLRA